MGADTNAGALAANRLKTMAIARNRIDETVFGFAEKRPGKRL